MNLILVLSNKLALNINEYMKKDREEFEKLKYGICVLLVNISKITSLFVLSYVLGVFKLTLLYFLCFCFIRSFAFGAHAEKSLNCTLSNYIIFIGGTYLSNYLRLNNYYVILVFVLNLIILVLYAPADTKARPIGKRLRKKLKTKALVATLILMIAALIIPNSVHKSIIAFSVFSEALCIMPLTYKILKKEYGNYEKCINK